MSEKKNPTGDYPYGYARPPEHSKWTKGKSGNPKGRPKKQPYHVASILDAPVQINTKGKKRYVSSFEAGFRRLAQKAVQGNTSAIIKFIRLCEEYKAIVPPPIIHGGGVITAPSGVDFREWLESVTELVPADED